MTAIRWRAGSSVLPGGWHCEPGRMQFDDARSNFRQCRAERQSADSERAFVDPAILEEVDRLPGNYRAPIVLCYLEGSTHEGAARQLGWPLGTVRGRLARARELLKTRLTRRGLSVPSTLMGAGVVANEAHAAVPAVLVKATTQSALAIAAGTAVDVSARVAAWTEAGLRSTTLIRWKAAAAAVVLLRPRPRTCRGIANQGFARTRATAQSLQPAEDDRNSIQGTWSKMEASTSYIGGVAPAPEAVQVRLVGYCRHNHHNG